MRLQLLFNILAVVLLGTAAVLLWQQQREYAFAAAVLSACAFFLGMRFELKAQMNERQADRPTAEEPPDREDD